MPSPYFFIYVCWFLFFGYFFNGCFDSLQWESTSYVEQLSIYLRGEELSLCSLVLSIKSIGLFLVLGWFHLFILSFWILVLVHYPLSLFDGHHGLHSSDLGPIVSWDVLGHSSIITFLPRSSRNHLVVEFYLNRIVWSLAIKSIVFISIEQQNLVCILKPPKI